MPNHDIVFMASLFMVVIILRLLLVFAKSSALVVIRSIVSSWIFLLAVLFVFYLLGFWAVVLLSVAMLIKGIHEIIKLWQSDINNPQKIIQLFLVDLILLAWLIIYCLSFACLYYQLNQYGQTSILLWLIFCVQVSDVCQYIMGKSLGQCFFIAKLAPSISPNKTIEGIIFGIPLMALLATFLGSYLTPFNHMQSFLLAVLLGVFGVAGDLLQSFVKRCHQIKDMGTWLKGHGGLLDRIDSLLLSLPLFWGIYLLFLV